MNTNRIFCCRHLGFVLLLLLPFSETLCQGLPRPGEQLATVNVNLAEATEVGLEIDARTPGGSWGRSGSEAAALLVTVDGVYNQDLLLWAGDQFFRYRILLGRLSNGNHRITVTLNPARSAPKVQRAEVKTLQPLLFANSSLDEDDRFALAHSPVLYARANTIDRFTDIPMLMYYEVLPDPRGDRIIRYTAIFTNEDGGTQTTALMARWGRATDIEWVFQLRVRGDRIIEETFQGIEHETKVFSGSRVNGTHPILATASDNNNFSDLACAAVRFAPLPTRARLEHATRESTMDAYPQTYRVMTEELRREGRIAEARLDVNTIADPRDYVYLEASSEQSGAAIAFDVKVNGKQETFSSDLGIASLRIDRSGNFRTAVRIPKGVAPGMVQQVTARCHATEAAADSRGCRNVKLLRVLMLDSDFSPREIEFTSQPVSSLMVGESRVFGRK